MSHKRDVFFISSGNENLFAIYYYPAGTSSEKGNILYIHPFADEMNKSRRMAALQARSFSYEGFGVLQIDLFGCGDSKGEFGEATWKIWKDNINTAVNWLLEKSKNQISLWGLRLGALLMMDFAKTSPVPIKKYIFWQPVLNGKMAMHQFMRLASASQMMRKNGESSKELREKISQGQNIEIGGYEINPELMDGIEKTNMADLCPLPDSKIIWKEISLNNPSVIAPAGCKIIEHFRKKKCEISTESITGDAFWSSIEISTVPDLITSTTMSMMND